MDVEASQIQVLWLHACVLSCIWLFSTLLTVCSPPGSSAHGIFQARILERVAISSSRGCSWPRDWAHITWISCINRQILYPCITWEALKYCGLFSRQCVLVLSGYEMSEWLASWQANGKAWVTLEIKAKQHEMHEAKQSVQNLMQMSWGKWTFLSTLS